MQQTRISRGSLRCLVMIGVAIGLAACGDDDMTGPVDADIVGDWSYTISNARSPAGSTCGLTGFILSFGREDSSLSGVVRVNNGSLDCGPDGGTDLDDGIVALQAITASGGSVSFDFDGAQGPVHSTGTFTSDNAMSGRVTLTLTNDVDGAQVFTGDWRATRQ